MIFDDFASVPTSLSEREFEAVCSEMVAEMRAGMPLTIADICHRLCVSPDYLQFATAQLVMKQTGEPVMLCMPSKNGRLQ